MKRVGCLYDKMLDKELIRNSIHDALRHKKKTRPINEVLNNINYYVEYFYKEIKNRNYTFTKGYIKTILNSGKQRKIQVPSLKDHIMHHIIVSVLKPIIQKSMYEWNCGVIPNRGCIYAKSKLEKIISKHKPKYVLKVDIKKYFHNIDTNVLLGQLGRRIKDREFLNLISNLLNTANDNSGKGIPIGFYTSQWLSNFYLQDLDYFIKQELKAKWYFRYMDDLVILGNNKRELHRFKSKIFKYMKDHLKLEPNNKYQVFPHNKRHIDFVGYLFYQDKTKLRKRTFKIFKRRLRIIKSKKYNIHHCRSYMSLRGWLVHCCCGKKFLRKHEPLNLYSKVTNYISKVDRYGCMA